MGFRSGSGSSGASYAARIDALSAAWGTEVGTWGYSLASATAYGPYANNSTAALNDARSHPPVAMVAGTYTVELDGGAGPDAPIISVQIAPDAATWTTVATFDQYAAGAVIYRGVQAGVVIPAGSYYLRVIALSKNGSSSAYKMRYRSVGFTWQSA